MRTVIGILPSVAEAKHVVHEFEMRGIAQKEISVVAPEPDTHEEKRVDLSKRTNAMAARAGALRGVVLGLLLGGAMLSMHGVRPFLFDSAWATLAASALVVGVLMSALVVAWNMGRSHEEAGLYEEAVHENGVVVAVHVNEHAEPDALKVLEENGARDLHAAADVAHLSRWTAVVPDSQPYPCDSAITAH